jgi:type II secretory pathway pseudopilin PulG
MELILVIAAIVLALAAYPVYRYFNNRKVMKEQKAAAERAFIARLDTFMVTIKALPVSELTLNYWWYQRLGFRGPWKRFERTRTFRPSPNDVRLAASYYLRALENGGTRERTFTDQAELVVFVQENIRAVYQLNIG